MTTAKPWRSNRNMFLLDGSRVSFSLQPGRAMEQLCIEPLFHRSMCKQQFRRTRSNNGARPTMPQEQNATTCNNLGTTGHHERDENLRSDPASEFDIAGFP
ncbi:uncharacterized protein UBRO_08348 [Ustilago bromivora]|uniref:Uncharacterized protein n=1 Tax=Ustilago bromivora TaxID=307758 RepID=A0A1K0GZU9_9BASI|nr:uncharacterized protein UBRO_08348 [Ustilago bromivora]